MAQNGIARESTIRRVAFLPFVLLVLLSGCLSDQTVALMYEPPPPATPMTDPVSVLTFTDQRGSEGDRGDPYRVGGVYGGLHNRAAKILVARPWRPQLVEAIVAELKAQGVDARLGSDAGARFALDGEVHDFSTETYWGNTAHIALVVRLRDASGAKRFEKRYDVRESSGFVFEAKVLEDLLNRAFSRIVRMVATDPELLASLRR